MSRLVKPQRICRDMVVSWLRSDVKKLNRILMSIKQHGDYQDDYTISSLESVEIGLRHLRKFINAN